MRKANWIMAILTAAVLYAVNPYDGLTKLQQVALFGAYMSIGTIFAVACGILAGVILDMKKHKRFCKMVKATTL